MLSHCLFNFYAEYIREGNIKRNVGLGEPQAGINSAKINTNSLRYADDTSFTYGRKWSRTKEPLDESERGEWNCWINAQHSENEDHGIWSHHFLANKWGNSGNSSWLYFSGLQNHCKLWLQPWNWKMLTPWKESYHQPRQHIKKQRHYFANKFHLVKAMVFPEVMYGCENWTIKKAEHRRIDVFELWCWRRLLRVPWTARRSN